MLFKGIMMQSLQAQIKEYLKKLDALLVAHYYQCDEVVEIADTIGDSLELARKASQSPHSTIVFCGVAFMGQSVKVLAPQKRVIMPKLACCSMARMIDDDYFDESMRILKQAGLQESDIFPITYINSNASIKAKVGKMGGVCCTSSNALKIFEYALQTNKKIFFLPDRCLGINLADKKGLKSCVLSKATKDEILQSQVICYDGYCSVHQIFSVKDIEFYRNRYKNILIVSHPECDPSVIQQSDFVGSTSQIIQFVESLDKNQSVAIATEANLVNRLRKDSKNIFVLSRNEIPQCPTMNETSLPDVLRVLEAFSENGSNLFKSMNEVIIPSDVAKYAKIALYRMLELS